MCLMPCRVLLTTIPKCGKNLLVSFFSALGLARRLDDGDLAEAASHAQARWLLREQIGQGGGHSIHDLVEFLSGTATAFDRALTALDGLPDTSFVQGHFAYDPELHQRAQDAGVTIVFLYRDPRACLASTAHFLIERGEPAALVPQLPRHDLDAAYELLIQGNDVTPPFEAVYAPYDGWRDAEGVISVRFEDIVGPRGHGSMMAQASTLTALAEGIGWAGSRIELLHSIFRTFEPRAGTFRRGTLDGWRDDMTSLAGTPLWASIEELAGHWGYDDGPSLTVPAIADDLLTELLGGIHAEHTLESEANAHLSADIILRDQLIKRQAFKVAELQARTRRLGRRVDALESRVILRLVDRVARVTAHLIRHPR
jgi:hypothetical protein